MIKLTREQLRKLQMTQLDMLLEVKRVCEKNDIKYSLIGGTLLGAVRHKGYIPWDDDADVGMLRGDYEKFRKLCKTELDKEKYYFQDDRNTEGYRWGYGKLRRRNSLFLRENQSMLRFGQEIFIDIFPLDHTPDGIVCRSIHAFHMFCMRKALWSPIGSRVETNPVKKEIYSAMSHIPKEKIYRHYYSSLKRVGRTDHVRLSMFPTGYPYGYPKIYFEELCNVEFEGHVFKGSKYYDAYLRQKYGDYMKLPEKADRKVHPIEAFRLPEDMR